MKRPVIDHDELLDAVESQMIGLENPGFCTECGAYHDECEPDMRKHTCDECGELCVYGAEELMMMGY
jgi:hypothetical protein